MNIPDAILEQLRTAGLLVSDPCVSGHIAYPDGVIIAKPVDTPGHHVPGMLGGWGLDGPMVDAPPLYLHHEGKNWLVTLDQCVPSPGPGDFVNSWSTPEEAVADILDFYFGSPYRMEVQRRLRKYAEGLTAAATLTCTSVANQLL